MITVYADVQVEVDASQVIRDADAEDISALVKAALEKGKIAAPVAFGQGDAPRMEAIIERAYCAARNMPSVPREIADLFWHVHGRALA